MKSKFMAVVAGAVLAVPMAAQAHVSVYGRAQVELRNHTNELAGVSTTNRGLVDANMGRIGADATEDLGSGITGLAHFGFNVDTSPQPGGNGGIGISRQSYVGIAGSLGILRFGRVNGVYKDTDTDPYTETVLEARALGGESAGNFGNEGFINDAVKYDNQFGKVTLAALMTAGNAANGDNGDYQLAADYKSGPLRLIWAYSENKDEAGIAIPTEKRTKLALQYGNQSGTLTLQHETVENYNTADLSTSLAADLASLGLSGNVGSVNFDMLSYNTPSMYMRYGQEDYKQAAGFPGGLKFKSYAVALQHKLSKTFRIWAGYFVTQSDPTDLKITNVSLGMRADF